MCCVDMVLMVLDVKERLHKCIDIVKVVCGVCEASVQLERTIFKSWLECLFYNVFFWPF